MTDESKAATKERKLFKDYFDAQAATAMASQMKGALPSFDERAFILLATTDLQTLEFADRVKLFSSALRRTLPDSVPKALRVLAKSLPKLLPNSDSVTDGWLQWPVGQFIADYGVDHFEPSMKAMIELTQRFSSEFAVRPFVEQHPERTFAALSKLTGHKSEHVRRWCSEGTRPRLPWGRKLRDLVHDPSPIWPILEALKDDPSLYVRRSVANNINDIAKDHPADVVARCKKWSAGLSEERAWLIGHGLRTLVKDGDPRALAVLGFGAPKSIDATLKLSPKRIPIGTHIVLDATLSSRARKTQKLMVDFVVHYVRKSGQTSEKVFKWKPCEIRPKETLSLTKKHALKLTSIRKLYPGKHRVELQVNGVRVGECSFVLTASA